MRTRLHHVALAVQDEDLYCRSVDFYRQVLELPLVRQWARPPKRITMLDFGSSILEIILGAEGSGAGAFPHIALAVDRPEDVEAMLARCAEAGCTVIRPADDVEGVEEVLEDGEIRWGAPVRLRNGFCLGPAGEQIEFFWEE
ncbi:VOC family protein [Mailhella sp.]|uniref:VOC family protein n=1 Tax=Mailhella sp. TaxID=1981029 RepID=UPI0040629814